MQKILFILLALGHSANAIPNPFKLGIIPNPFSRGHKIVVTFDNNKTIELNQSTSCSLSATGNAANSCTCCILKHTYHVKNLNDTSALKAIKYCITKKHCSSTNLASAQSQPTTYVKKLQEKYIKTGEVKLSEISQNMALDLSSPLTEATVPAFLRTAAQQSLVTSPDKQFFMNPSCTIKATKLGSGGFQTGLLFGISLGDDCGYPEKFGRKFQYILKETKKKTIEMKNLVVLRNNEYLAKLSFMGSNLQLNKYLMLAFEVAHLIYGEGQKRYFTLSNTAPGVPFSKIFEKYAKNAQGGHLTEDDRAELEKVMYRLGYRLGNFHQIFMDYNTLKTVTHKDLHIENVFIDQKNDVYTMIDLETMAPSLKNKSHFAIDLLIFTMFPLLTKTFGLPKEISPKVWSEMIGKFIQGYLASFYQHPPMTRKIYNAIKDSFLKGTTLYFFKERGLAYNPITMTKIQTSYLKPMFAKLDQIIAQR
jgi:hypothetical protein